MLFDDLIGQEVAKKVLRQAWAEQRLAQSYLFYGPDGVGKETAALDLALAINCGSPEGQPCRACSSCRRTAAYGHPDFHYLAPVPHSATESERRKIAEEIAEQLKEKAARPQLSLTFDRPVAITIDDIRELKERLALRPYEGDRKIALIIRADQMTTEAANAFLKILEEPSPTTFFVLVTDRPNYLLPTIVSRCQKVRFDLLPSAEISRHLIERHGQDGTGAGLVADLAAGSLGRALDMLGDDFREERDLAWDILGQAAEGNYYVMLEGIGAASEERGKPERVLNLIEEIASDLMHFRISGRCVNADRADRIQRMVQRYDQRQLEDLVGRIERSKSALASNVTPKLCLIAACIGPGTVEP